MTQRKPAESNGGWERRDKEELLEVMEPAEPYTAGELAEQLEWPTRTVLYCLNRLADEGEVRKKKPGYRTVIWIKLSSEE